MAKATKTTKKTATKKPATRTSRTVAAAKKAPAKSVKEKTTKSTSVRAKLPDARTRATQMYEKNKRKILIGLGLLLLVVALLLLRSVLVAATVNGKIIPRWEVVNKLEDEMGATVLDELVTAELIKQEAEEKNITVSEDEINKQMQEIEKQISDSGQNLDALLAAREITRDELREQIRNQKTLEKLLGNKINVTEADINKYLEDNKAQIPEGTDITSKEVRDSVKSQLAETKFSTEYQKLVEDLKKKSQIKNYVTY